MDLDLFELEEEQQELFEHFRLVADRGQEPVRLDKYIATHQEDTSRHRERRRPHNRTHEGAAADEQHAPPGNIPRLPLDADKGQHELPNLA